MTGKTYRGENKEKSFLYKTFCLFRAIKDGYESDSTLSYRRHNFVPLQNSSSENKNLYTQVQRGGEVPRQGLRMQAPEKKGNSVNISSSCA